MEKEKRRKYFQNRTIFRVLETITDIAALAVSMQMLADFMNVRITTLCTTFVLNAMAFAFGAINTGRTDKLMLVKYLIYSGAYLAGAAVIYVTNGSIEYLSLVFMFYAAAMIAGRVISVRKKRRVVNIAFNVLAIIFWASMALLLAAGEEIGDIYSPVLIGIMVPCQLLIRITQLSFAHIRYDILFKVIRKSMAAEILTGLLILIVAFSFALCLIEPQIETYEDALWYCFAIVTTIGFGDMTAVTDMGRILSVILGLYGIIVVALITSVIVNFYTEINNEDKARTKPAVTAEPAPAEPPPEPVPSETLSDE